MDTMKPLLLPFSCSPFFPSFLPLLKKQDLNVFTVSTILPQPLVCEDDGLAQPHTLALPPAFLLSLSLS